MGATIDNLSIPSESRFWVRWTDIDLADALDDGLGIDRFEITPAIVQLPEPSGLVLFAGLAALCASGHLRRR
jgi:hypothetical protein